MKYIDNYFVYAEGGSGEGERNIPRTGILLEAYMREKGKEGRGF